MLRGLMMCEDVLTKFHICPQAESCCMPKCDHLQPHYFLINNCADSCSLQKGNRVGACVQLTISQYAAYRMTKGCVTDKG